MKGGVAKKTRTAIINTYGPGMTEILEELWPKKGPRIDIMKLPDKVEVVIVDQVPLFYKHRDNQWIPTLQIVHRWPSIMTKQTCDRGAIKFVLGGANIMCPGLTHEKAVLDKTAEKGDIVAIYVEELLKFSKHVCSVWRQQVFFKFWILFIFGFF